ncbi:MAG: phosphoribosylamine/glycine ligase [Variovorax sp.]|nr:phosphoribosylamine/glycine ligase [Variovorax sp.]
MRVLVIGGGGREHALAWKLAQSDRVSRVFVAPGNGGTALDKRLENIDITEPAALRAWALQQKISLTVVGPEGPLAAGVVDEFRAHGLRIFGPTRAAAQLESSKAFSKAFMQRHKIPTAEYESFTEAAPAHAYVDAKGVPIVVKADGLAAGKGVVVAMTAAEAHEAIDFMLEGDRFGVTHNEDQDGKAAPRVVIEEFLHGEEASFMVLCDGRNVVALATSQDHKRLQDGDAGPNTGGMGAYSPAPVVTATVHARAMREVILPAIRGMERDGIPYTGFLYAGLMIDAEGHVKTLEFNCRMGDPETQPILLRLKSDLFEVLWHATDGTLDTVELQWDRRTALGVVMAADGYPLAPRKGDRIMGIPPEAPDAVVFQAGTALHDGELRTSGGRVLCVTALADNVRLAQQRAYEVACRIQFEGAQYRRDIGFRGMPGARQGT